MLYRFRSRCKFLLRSSNQHGVHSPFVYRYLTEGIYPTKKVYPNLSKQDRLLQATIDYFQIQEVIGEQPTKLPNTSRKLEIKTESNTYKYLYYVSDLEQLCKEELEKLIKTIDEASLLYIATPYKSEKTKQRFLQLYAQNKFHVSIDFYFAGVLATRKQQVKEHFTLRL